MWRCSARVVFGPMMPSGADPTVRCNALTSVRDSEPLTEPPTQRSIAAFVFGPRMPSTTSATELRCEDDRTGVRVAEREAASVEAAPDVPPFARVRPARAPQVGQAPGPCEARTRWATVIC